MAKQGRCAHHWVIQSSVGASSRGVCKYCGAGKRFSNFRSPQARPKTARMSRGQARA